MRILAFSALALGFGLTAVQLSACSNSSDDCNATATCGATAGTSHAGSAGKSGGGSDGGVTGGGGNNVGGSSGTSGTAGSMGNGGDGGAGGSACTGEVSDDAACWTTNELGVFVSSDAGDDSAGTGTKEMPFKTITKGIAASAGKNVYVCVGASDYSEKISLDLSNDGIHIYGGFECSTWTYATTRSAQVLSPSNIALRIDGLKKGAHIENVSFKAADATGAGTDASSYGGFVTGSKGVVLTRVELTAGAGAEGVAGKDGTKGTDGAAQGTAPAGTAGICGPFSPDDPPEIGGGKWPAENSCGSQGGPGGTGAKSTGSADSGNGGIPTEHVTPLSGIDNGGPGESTGVTDFNGKPGMAGDAGANGDPARTTGAFAASGFTPADGKSGTAGYAGQGGGGGGASKGTAACFGASGGAGGMGGCGGAFGAAGGGGGASVGLLSWASNVTLVACVVQSAAGGAGGAGGKGGGLGLGAPGGAGGPQDIDGLVALGGNGGHGGNGGRGGNGSGGTGGPSYALVYSGIKPAYDAGDTTLTPGAPGAAGVGGQQVSTTQAPNGSVGQADQELEVQ